MPKKTKIPADPPQKIAKARGDGSDAKFVKDQEFIVQAMQRFKVASEAEQENRNASLDDVDFSVGKQWPSDIETSRVADNRPCLTMNHLPQVIRQVENNQRRQRLGIQVNPVGDGADVEVAEILQGAVRHVEIQSDAEIAYDTGFDAMLRGGFGYWRIITDFVNPTSFDQEIYIKRIKNQFTVYFDPFCIEPDYSDAGWCFIVEDLDQEDYDDQFPNSKAASAVAFESIGDRAPGWATKDTIRVAEYFYKKLKRRTLVETYAGDVGWEEDFPNIRNFRRSREVQFPEVKWAKINAIETLEKRNWLGKYIPVVPVLGEDLDINGKRYLAGMIRNAKDPQRMYNFWVSAMTESIALAPRAPWVAVEGQLEGHEVEWKQSNVRNLAVLQYKSVDVDGKPAPPPERVSAEPPIEAMSRMLGFADNDLKASTGIYDASLGQPGPEQSGKAILARQTQGDNVTYNYSDNLSRSLRHTGRILIDLFPHIYDAPRILRIVAPDGKVSHVGVFNGQKTKTTYDQAQQHFADAMTSNPDGPTIKRCLDLSVGTYDVNTSAEPSHQSRRQAAVESIMALVNSFPAIMQVAGDLLVGNMDWPHAQEIAKRMRSMLPPQVLETLDGDDPRIIVSKMQSQLSQLSEQHSALTAELQQATMDLRTQRYAVESKERIAMVTQQNQLLLAMAKIEGEGALTQLQGHLDIIQKRLELLHSQMSMDQEQETEEAAAATSTEQQPTGAGQ